MATSDRVARDRRAKRARILDTARELFVTRGVEAVTLREIAQRIEYSTTAIYVQFKDKQDLLDQMVREDFVAFTSALTAVAAVADPVRRVRRLADAYVDFALRMPRHYQLMFMTRHVKRDDEPARADELPPTGMEGYRALRDAVAECIATGRFRPELRDADGLAQAVWTTAHGAVSLLLVMGEAPEFRWRTATALADLALTALLRGMLADPDDLPRRRTPRR